jgi:hypothetical protein
VSKEGTRNQPLTMITSAAYQPPGSRALLSYQGGSRCIHSPNYVLRTFTPRPTEARYTDYCVSHRTDLKCKRIQDVLLRYSRTNKYAAQI